MKIAASADSGKCGIFPVTGYHLLNREVVSIPAITIISLTQIFVTYMCMLVHQIIVNGDTVWLVWSFLCKVCFIYKAGGGQISNGMCIDPHSRTMHTLIYYERKL